jgi:hypothetical protein
MICIWNSSTYDVYLTKWKEILSVCEALIETILCSWEHSLNKLTCLANNNRIFTKIICRRFQHTAISINFIIPLNIGGRNIEPEVHEDLVHLLITFCVTVNSTFWHNFESPTRSQVLPFLLIDDKNFGCNGLSYMYETSRPICPLPIRVREMDSISLPVIENPSLFHNPFLAGQSRWDSGEQVERGRVPSCWHADFCRFICSRAFQPFCLCGPFFQKTSVCNSVTETKVD